MYNLSPGLSLVILLKLIFISVKRLVSKDGTIQSFMYFKAGFLFRAWQPHLLKKASSVERDAVCWDFGVSTRLTAIARASVPVLEAKALCCVCECVLCEQPLPERLYLSQKLMPYVVCASVFFLSHNNSFLQKNTRGLLCSLPVSSCMAEGKANSLP